MDRVKTHGIKQKSAARMKFTVNHLEKHLTDFIFQHDNDPKHNAMAVKTYLTLKKKNTHTHNEELWMSFNKPGNYSWRPPNKMTRKLAYESSASTEE